MKDTHWHLRAPITAMSELLVLLETNIWVQRKQGENSWILLCSERTYYYTPSHTACDHTCKCPSIKQAENVEIKSLALRDGG